MGKQLEEHFTVTDMDLEMKRTKVRITKTGKKTKVVETYVSSRSICHATNTSDYIQHLIKIRGLDPARTMVRLGIDGGGGSLKILVSIFDPTVDGDAPHNWMDLFEEDEWIIQGEEHLQFFTSGFLPQFFWSVCPSILCEVIQRCTTDATVCLTSTSNGGCHREEKSRKHWLLFTKLLSFVTANLFFY